VIDWVVGATRLLQFASGLGLFGSALFSLYGATAEASSPTRIGDTERAASQSPWLLTAVVGLASTLAWLSSEAASLTGEWTAVGTLLTETRFGRIAALRAGLFALALLACLVVRQTKVLAIVVSILGCAIVASFAWTGHGAIDTGSARLLHLGSDMLHLLAAGIWFGALWSLSILSARSIRIDTPTDAQHVARGLTRFSVIGPTVVGLLILTGMVNTWYLVGKSRWTALFDTSYGLLLVAKLAMFGGMLGLAAINRWRLTPRLDKALAAPAATAASLLALRWSVLAETALAFLVLAIVAVLGTLAPPVSGE
jgi:putative copper resistance protein D